MSRRIFDIIMTSLGTLLTVAFLTAGGLAWWGHSFAYSNVRQQLTEQQIFFPPAGSPALASPEIGPFLDQYAGQQLTDGTQAKAYADHFIAVHLKGVAGGKTYAQVSSEAQANPTDATLQQQRTTLFQGETLRGLLLNAYAFWKLGEIAMVAAIVLFVLGGIMAALTLLGLWHLLTRAREGDQIFVGGRRMATEPGVTRGPENPPPANPEAPPTRPS